MIQTLSLQDFYPICDELGRLDADLASVLSTYDYPPLWSRPDTFESLVHIILEQQVSLASAKSALQKLQEKTGGVSPARLLALSDAELKACYFSRQKAGYVRGLAQAIVQGQLDLQQLETWPDGQIRQALLRIKGVGNWTADIYLMFVARRADIFPFGDLAAVNALKRVKQLAEASADVVIKLTEPWRPYRTVATMILWHYYLSVRAGTRAAIK